MKRGIRKTILKNEKKTEGLPFAGENNIKIFTEDQIIEITKRSGSEK